MNAIVQRYSEQQEPLRSERRAELVLLAALGFLLLLCCWGLYRALVPALAAPIPPAPDSLKANAVSSPVVVPTEERGEIVTRPLFWATRRPLEPVEVEVVAQTQPESTAKPLKGVTLKGVFGGADQAGIIVVSNGKKRRLWVGDDLNGWTLDSVVDGEVRFVDGANESVLTLKRGKPSGPSERGGETQEQRAQAGGKSGTAAKRNAATGRESSLGLGGGDRNRQGNKK